MRGPLVKDNFLFIFDTGSVQGLDVDSLVSGINATASSIVLVNAHHLQSFLSQAPVRFFRGSFLTTVLVFTENPLDFLKALNEDWNPDYLLLFNLNETLDSLNILSHETVQRSKHLTLIERERKPPPARFQVFTSRPFRPKHDGYAFKSPMGIWNRERYRTRTGVFPDRFETFDGAVLHLGSWCDDFPFLYPEGGRCVGTSFDLLDIIAGKFNFSYTVQMETADHNWGSKENGTWTGMLGDLIYNNKDLVINYFLLTEERNADFDTTYAYYSEGFGFALEIPPPVPQWRGLLYPFTRDMWITTICTTLLMVALLSLCLLLVPDTQDPSQVFLIVRNSHCYCIYIWLIVILKSILDNEDKYYGDAANHCDDNENGLASAATAKLLLKCFHQCRCNDPLTFPLFSRPAGAGGHMAPVGPASPGGLVVAPLDGLVVAGDRHHHHRVHLQPRGFLDRARLPVPHRDR